MTFTIDTLPAAHVSVPEPLSRLKELAYNYWWTWQRDARRLFERVDPDLWSRYRNPVRLIQLAHESRLDELSRDRGFLDDLDRTHAHFRVETTRRAQGAPVAYVSAEYALHESLPIYSGGLGVLSGDHLRETSDMDLPLIAVGLFYRRGYFRQVISGDGKQQHYYPDLDAYRVGVLRVADAEGNSLRISVPLDDREVQLRVWVAFVGRVPVLLLDAHNQGNPPEDRFITSQLYVRGRAMRLEQEVVLGRGAVAALDALGIDPRVWHMNEGHSAFLALENLARTGEDDIERAIEAVRPRHVFTTHTPVPAGNEVFEHAQVRPYLQDLCRRSAFDVDQLLALGHAEQSHTPGFNLTALALHLSGKTNGVSQLHAEVSRSMWPGHEIRGITNGVHMATWLGREMSTVLGSGTADPRVLAERVSEVSDEALWAAHLAQKHRLMRFVRVRQIRQAARHGHAPKVLRRLNDLLNPNALTIGFARRFASYKRADLLFHDTARLTRLLTDTQRPVQLIMAGKAHPADDAGQKIIRDIWERASEEPLRGRIVFVEDYDMSVARLMVRGVDVWLNVPEWPREASGTSGMKAAANGVLHASVPDGWWAEVDDGLGFTLGEQGPPDRARDAEVLYRALEDEIVPLYYDRPSEGLPAAWVQRMRRSMQTFLAQFSTRRMMEQYAAEMYDLGAD